MIRFACQSCNKKLRTADTDAGKTRPCPKCRAMILVLWPDSVAEASVETFHEPKRPASPVPLPRTTTRNSDDPAEPASKPTKRGHVLIAGTVVCCAFACAAIAFLFFRASSGSTSEKNRDTSEKNRDYLEILQLKYENAAVLRLSAEWRNGSSRSFPFEAYREPYGMIQPVFDRASWMNDELERQIISKRKDFATDRGVDSIEWTNSFKKSFPERDVIFDEIESVIRPLVVRQILKSSSDVFQHRTDTFYCREYFRINAPMFVEEAIAEARGLQSIKSLRAKVIKGG